MPFVRPIVRGKKNASVEFGPKLAVSIVDGFTFMEKLSFDASMKALHSRIRWNDSRSVMDITQLWSMPIRSTGTETISDSAKSTTYAYLAALGRPSKDPKVLKEQRKQEREDTKIRNGVEGKFGEGKRFYGLGLVMTRLQDTCETVIAMQLLVLNLERKLRILLAIF